MNSTRPNVLFTELSPELNLNSSLPSELCADLSSELNINMKLPPELLTKILQFLPFGDLNNVLLVCRLAKNRITVS